MKLSLPPKLMVFWVSPPPWMLMYFFAGLVLLSPCVWPNSGCCVFLTLRITLLAYGSFPFAGIFHLTTFQEDSLVWPGLPCPFLSYTQGNVVVVQYPKFSLWSFKIEMCSAHSSAVNYFTFTETLSNYIVIMPNL